jgi:hypothetical protein
MQSENKVLKYKTEQPKKYKIKLYEKEEFNQFRKNKKKRSR